MGLKQIGILSQLYTLIVDAVYFLYHITTLFSKIAALTHVNTILNERMKRMDNKTNKSLKEKEILACNEEVSRELFSKELHVIVTDGVKASLEQGGENS
ncbi:hypothetical protein ACFVAD_09070 [Sutcliffiella sp. NPDC057660]|uniref:hypothetical protein n=1 Tax=Sutcliffiella sp. NPDC057660 TaxID=3346199 RepID=UPI00369A7741